MPKLKDGRPVVRLHGRGHLKATPYLQEWLPKLPNPRPQGRLAVDLGCGTGRNSRALIEHGYRVLSFDMECEYSMAQPWVAGQGLPIGRESVSLLLCQYVLMFLTDMEIAITLDEIQRVLRPGGHVIFEIQPGVCTARPVNLDRVVGYLVGAGRWNAKGPEWRVVHFTKERCVLEKISLISGR